MDAWWTGLGSERQIFYGIALFATLLLLVQLVLLFFGAEVDADVDADLGGAGDVGHGDAGGSVFSVRSLSAFLAGFGWAGVAALQAGWSVGAATLAALAVGGLFMGGILALMRALMGLRDSGTLDYHNAIGQVGTVYLAVPAAMAGPGRIEVHVQGRLAVVEAFTRAPRPLAARERVRVTDVLDQTTLVVEPLESPAREP